MRRKRRLVRRVEEAGDHRVRTVECGYAVSLDERPRFLGIPCGLEHQTAARGEAGHRLAKAEDTTKRQ